MSLSKVLKAAKVSVADCRKIRELVRDGQTGEQAVESVLKAARQELEGVRDDLRDLGFRVDIQRIEKRKESR